MHCRVDGANHAQRFQLPEGKLSSLTLGPSYSINIVACSALDIRSQLQMAESAGKRASMAPASGSKRCMLHYIYTPRDS